MSASDFGAPQGSPSRGRPLSGLGRTAGGIAAIGAKELRGRMRGRRAFVILTIYLLLLAGFAFMVQTLIARGFETGFGGSSAFASAAIGQGIFAALLMLMTLQVVFLASSSTTGAISLEREKQTLDLLAATPISSVAIVIGKLLSALVYLFLLIAASIPLMAMVFVYGGIAPEDVVRGYLVLLVTAIGLGAFGLMCSSLVRRTTAATAITIFGALALTIGTGFILIFWAAMGSFDDNGERTGGPFGIRTPAILAYVNPFVAQADVLCGTEATFGGAWCSGVEALVPSDRQVGDGRFSGRDLDNVGGAPDVIVRGEEAIDRRVDVGGDVVVDDVAPAQIFEPERDALWPKSIVTWLVLSVIFLAVSVQMVSPTRRWRWQGRSDRGASASEASASEASEAPAAVPAASEAAAPEAVDPTARPGSSE